MLYEEFPSIGLIVTSASDDITKYNEMVKVAMQYQTITIQNKMR